jgi:hypothetical protein
VNARAPPTALAKLSVEPAGNNPSPQVKLVSASDGAELPGEKTKGEAPGSSSGLPPELSAVLGKRARLTLGQLPLAVLQLKRRGVASNATVGAAVLALEDVQAELDQLEDLAVARRNDADEVDREVVAHAPWRLAPSPFLWGGFF